MRGARRCGPINATIGFDRLGEVLHRLPLSLMRMFGWDGNPTAENLLGVIGAKPGCK
jgi:hypothetical protein